MIDPPAPERRTLLRGKLWFWLPIAPLVALDLWSKSAVFAFLRDTFQRESLREYHVWGSKESLQLSLVAWRNPGTIWGLGQSFTDVLIVARCVALLLILYFVRKLPAQSRMFQLVLGMIMAGAIGNLWDNFTQVDPYNGQKGGVRDFLLFEGAILFGKRFPAFNVADSCICVGAIALAVMLWRGDSVARTACGPALPS